MRVHGSYLLGLAILLSACSPKTAGPPPPPPPPDAEQQFASLERRYVIFILGRFPVVSTYLGGSEFDAALADNDGKLRDYSAEALKDEDSRLGEFREQFAALEPKALSSRRRIDRNVALAEIEFLLHQHEVLRHQERSLDSYVDEPFRGVDWQIQGMTPTGASTYGTEAEWQAVIARTRAVAAYLAVAEKQLAAGVTSRNTPDWRMLRDHGLKAPLADAEYFSKTLPQIAGTDIASAHKDALLADLQKAGDDAAAAYQHLRAFVADSRSFNGYAGAAWGFCS